MKKEIWTLTVPASTYYRLRHEVQISCAWCSKYFTTKNPIKDTLCFDCNCEAHGLSNSGEQ